jgi:hypothetical protein
MKAAPATLQPLLQKSNEKGSAFLVFNGLPRKPWKLD